MNAGAAPVDDDGRTRGVFALAAMGGLLFALFAAFLALGIWQVQRLQWKRELIARVDGRIHAAPAHAPARSDWPMVDAAHDEYRRVTVEGEFLRDHDTRVQALTDEGAGDWLLSPLRTADDGIVLVNRGFVPSAMARHTLPPPPGRVRVTGLLRISEPGGAFLRPNDPLHDRWHSRDVAAIATARHLPDVAPYFIDAQRDASPPAPRWPEGGLAVVRFPNNHLQYAITWFALAALTAFAGLKLVSGERRLRHHAHSIAAGRAADAGLSRHD